VISNNAIFSDISGIMHPSDFLADAAKRRFSGARFFGWLLIVSFALAACADKPAPAIWLPTDPAPSSEAPLIQPGLEQAADDYVDAVAAGAPDALYDIASKTFTDVVQPQAA
jgi:hypothetical protein